MARTSVEPGLALDDQLCFALYAASRALTARYRPILDALGLTYTQYLVMLVLWESGPASVSELGARLQLDSGTLSPLLKRLEGNGLISRRRRVDDERCVEVSLSAKGRRLRDRARPIPAQIGASTGLDPTAAARLTVKLHAIAACAVADLHSID